MKSPPLMKTLFRFRNVEFPLFGKEYSRADFEEKLKENPANDHLKVIVTESQKTEIPAEEKPDSIRLSIGFSEHPAFMIRRSGTVIPSLALLWATNFLAFWTKSSTVNGGRKQSGRLVSQDGFHHYRRYWRRGIHL